MSELKYKIGDRVKIKSIDWYNENKNEFGDVKCSLNCSLTKSMSIHCGSIQTIECVVDGGMYWMKENPFNWADEMIEGLVEEECTQDFIEKYCKSCGTQRCDRTKEYLNGCPYYNAYMCKKQNDDMEEEMLLDKAGQITDFEYEGLAYTLPNGYQFVDENGNVINATKIVLEKLVVPKFKKGDKIKDKNNRVWYVVHVGNKHFDISSVPNGSDGSDLSGYFVPMEDQDEYELCPDKELPKTYEECCTVLRFHYDHYLTYDDEKDINPTKEEEEFIDMMDAFSRLIVCRNAYWKIAGEEMGLGKPWEPDWNNISDKYCIYFVSGDAWSKECQTRQCPFAFPTPEMRDAFKENFDKNLEFCKWLL